MNSTTLEELLTQPRTRAVATQQCDPSEASIIGSRPRRMFSSFRARHSYVAATILQAHCSARYNAHEKHCCRQGHASSNN